MSLPAKRPGHQRLISMEHASDVVRDAEGVRRRRFSQDDFFSSVAKNVKDFAPWERTFDESRLLPRLGTRQATHDSRPTNA